MFKFRTLTNVRPAGDNTPTVLTEPTKGNMKISTSGQAILGVGAGDYVAVVESAEGHVFICKGNKEKGANFGSKLGSPNGKDGGAMTFSSANTWETLKGSTNDKSVYRVEDIKGEDVEKEEKDDATVYSKDGEVVAVEQDGNTYHRLTFLRTEPKQVKGEEKVTESAPKKGKRKQEEVEA